MSYPKNRKEAVLKKMFLPINRKHQVKGVLSSTGLICQTVIFATN